MFLNVPHGQYQLSCFYENCGVCLFLYMRGRADFEFCLGTARLRRFLSFCRRRCSNKTILYYSTWFGFGFSICFFWGLDLDPNPKKQILNPKPNPSFFLVKRLEVQLHFYINIIQITAIVGAKLNF